MLPGCFRSRLAWAASLSFASFLSGCASAPVRAARAGDYSDLRAQIQARIDDGSLTRGQAGDVAHAVAEHEIENARGKEGVARIRELRACARDLDDALEERAHTRDEVGDEAAWARAQYGDEAVRYEDGAARRKAMADPRSEARRAAMRASVEARDPEDVPALAEAARVDPDGLVRTDAVRALGAIGGPEVAARLRDLWTSGDDALRGDVAIAWTRPGVFPHGGEEALKVILATQHGAGAVEAAAAVLRMRGEPAPSAELRDMAVALFVRTIQNDARRARLHALATAPVHEPGPILDAVRAATKDDDLEVRVSALARLVERDADRANAIHELEAIAGRDQGRVPRRALFALASAGDLRIQAWLEQALRAEQPEARVSSLVGLVALDRAPRGAALLADPDASVRTRAACILIGAAHRR